MLSKENVEKLVKTGLYKHEPDKKYRSSLYWDNMYHCFNWTFKVKHNESKDIWYMVDTYFNDKYIELTESTQEDAQAEYDEVLDSFVSEFEGLSISDELLANYRQLFVDLLAKTKYSVGEAEKDGELEHNIKSISDNGQTISYSDKVKSYLVSTDDSELFSGFSKLLAPYRRVNVAS